MEPINEPTNIENIPLWTSKLLAAQSFGVTAKTGHLGLCFATFLAVNPEWVNTIIRLAFISNDDLTAQLEIVSSVDIRLLEILYGLHTSPSKVYYRWIFKIFCIS